MNNEMFCFQCEQTAGVCGKKSDTAALQDKLTGVLIGLARATEGNEDLVSASTDKVILEGLSTTVTNVSFSNEKITELIAQVQEEKKKLIPNCFSCAAPCGRNNDYDMQELWTADEDIRSLKSLILFGIRDMAEYAYHASVLGYIDNEVNKFFYKALFAIGMDWGKDELLPIVLEVGEVNLKCKALLDKANSKTNGNPVPIVASLSVADKITDAVRKGKIEHFFLHNIAPTTPEED